MSPARCTVGLLTWNAGRSAIVCANSLAAQTEPHETIWIDNASGDDTVELLTKNCPNLPAPIVNETNRGFCGGHNQAIALCKTPFYLALNQDVILAPDYIARLCDWMESEPSVALASGLILWSDTADPNAKIYSAGLVWPRVKFPFELRMGRAPRAQDREKRIVPAVTGAAVMLRLEACRKVSIPDNEIFPNDFFAYHEELDLALRLARAGFKCGVNGEAIAWHAGQGSGGLRYRHIRAGFFANHWLLSLRHESWVAMLREEPYRVRGEMQYWLPRYLANPLAFTPAVAGFVARAAAARRFYHQFEREHGATSARVGEFKRLSLELLRESRE